MYAKHHNYNPFTFEGCSFIAFVILTPYLIWRELTKRFGNKSRRRKYMNLLHVKPLALFTYHHSINLFTSRVKCITCL